MIDITNWLVILLIFGRMTAFLATAPFFSIRNVPPLAKGALGLVLAVLLFPTVANQQLNLEMGLLGFTLLFIGEAFIGLTLGYASTLVFSAIKMAGQLIDMQIGLAMAGLFDPQSGGQSTLIGQFLDILGILLFMVMDYHHRLLLALAQSYALVPLGGFEYKNGLIEQLIDVFGGTFLLGLKIAAPVLAVLIIIDLSLGLVARTVPQLNVFILGFPMKIGIGIVTIALLTPLLATVFANVFNMIEKDLLLVLRSL